MGLTLNSLYINPRQFSFQLPLWQEMRRSGLPIEGLCVAAGHPTTEKAAEIIGVLKSVGIRHVAFKPGSIDGIHQVVNIAAANPDLPLSCSGPVAVLAATTPLKISINPLSQPTRVFVVMTILFLLQVPASVVQTIPGHILPGTGRRNSAWSQCLSMVSSSLLASWLPRRSHLTVRQGSAAGVDDSQWEGTYVKDTGGVITVRSELGEPIHKVNNRALMLWKEYDDSVLKLPFSASYV